jgi:hypothetical protein
MKNFYMIFLSLTLLTLSAFSQGTEVELETPVKLEDTSPLNVKVDVVEEEVVSEVTEEVVSTELVEAKLEPEETVLEDIESAEPKKEEAFAQKASKSLVIYFVLLLALLVSIMLLAWFIPAKSLKSEE